MFNYYGQTDKGKAKTLNEDTFSGFIYKDVLFLIVADGLGYKEGLEMASAIAINEIRRHIELNMESDKADDLSKLIRQGMFWTNRVLLAYKKANESLYSGFGTTLTVCAINKYKDIIIGHSGNTRLYLLRNGMLVQMTKDHTEAQRLFELGKISKEELRIHPERATLTKAMGFWEDIAFDVFGGKLVAGDVVMLCSDGVFNMLTDYEIQSILLESGESKVACEWLTKGANDRGGIDNIVSLISCINY